MKVIRLEQLMTVLATGMAILVVYALYQIAISHRQAKSPTLPERPAQKDSLDHVEAMKRGLKRAMGSLKGSMLGEEGVSTFPWYMLIGPPGSGKTTALKNSGLQASYPKESKEAPGPGVTRTCDWWLTNEGLFLDTAGRYTEEDEDRGEWLALLDMMKEQPRRVPLNGVLVMASLPDLLRADDKQIDLLGKNIRARLEELVERINVVFPVYLVFTKCDLLRGFVEFFENLNNVVREEQVWGYTFPLVPPPGMSPSDQFDMAFEQFLQALQLRRHGRLLFLRGSTKLQEVFSFPSQLSQAKQNLSHFVEQVFQPARHPDSPLFRGFYLTSAIQRGQPLDEVINAVNQRAGLAEPAGTPQLEPKEKGPYFIKQLFTGIVIPDQHLARLSSAAKQQQMLRTRMATVGTAAVGATFMAAAVYSYSLNREFGQQIQEAAESSYHTIMKDAKPFIDSAQDSDFDRFRQLVQVLQEDQEEAPPLMRRSGMNRESTVQEPARDLYVAFFNHLYGNETRAQLEDTLRTFAADPSKMPAGRDSDFYYSLLKTYLMLSPTSAEQPISLDRSFIAEWLKRMWQDILPAHYGEKPTPEVVKTVDQQIDTYSRVFHEGQGLFHRDEGLVEKARAALQQLPYPERIYARVQREIMQEYKPEPVTLTSLLQGDKQTLLESKKEIPGYFTPKFDSDLFDKTMNRILDLAGRDSWVLKMSDMRREDVRKAVEDLYREDYVNHWIDFLAFIKMRRANTRGEAVARLEVLTQDNSVLITLLKAVDKNTSFPRVTDILRDVSGGRVGGSAPSHPVAKAFHSFHEFVAPSAKNAGIEKYRQELEDMRNALMGPGEVQAVSNQLKARSEVDILIQYLDTRTQKAVGKLLREPFFFVLAPKCPDLYPFNLKEKQGITSKDFSDLYRPETGQLLEFYKSTVSPVALDTDEGYRQVKAISDAFFPPPSSEPDVRFEMIPQAIGGAAVREILMKIDGQELRYVNGYPELPVPFQWNGQSDEGALVQIDVDGKTYDKRYEGRWGLFRMLQDGHPRLVNPKNPTEVRLAWTFGVKGAEPVVARFTLKAERSKHPFAPKFFENFHCPKVPQ
jgi:type VI secretion system protein ImpL